MNKCENKNCDNKFPNRKKIDGKVRNLSSRKYCLTCSPFKEHNTKKLEKDKSATKVCTKCNRVLPCSTDYFYERSNSDSLRSECKDCFNSKRAERISKYRDEIKKKSVKYLGGQCNNCGYNKCLSALEFHHPDDNKTESISTLISKFGYSWDKVKHEVDKCILLCANCHREKHA